MVVEYGSGFFEAGKMLSKNPRKKQSERRENMADYVLSCCSTVDLNIEQIKKLDLSIVNYHFYLDDVKYTDDFGQSYPIKDFYKAMVNGADTKTAQVNVEEFTEYFTPILESGKDIVHICMSSGITGVFNSANIAKADLEEKFPDRKIYIVDSLAAASGYGLLMVKLAELRDEGYSAEQLFNWAEANKKKMHHWFFTTDLTFFVKGGRVSKVSGWFGTALKICPLLNVSNEGRLIPRQKLRGKAKAIEAIVKKMEECAENGLEYSGKCYICHSDVIDDAEAVKSEILARFKRVECVNIYDIGTTIGAHTGPGTVALFFWGNERID